MSASVWSFDANGTHFNRRPLRPFAFSLSLFLFFSCASFVSGSCAPFLFLPSTSLLFPRYLLLLYLFLSCLLSNAINANTKFGLKVSNDDCVWLDRVSRTEPVLMERDQSAKTDASPIDRRWSIVVLFERIKKREKKKKAGQRRTNKLKNKQTS